MAFNTADGRVEYTATAGQTLFTFVFKIYITSDIKVYKTLAGATPNDTTDLLVETTDYIVVINGDNGGDVTLTSGASVDDKITIVRDLPITRSYDYVTGGTLQANTLDADQDYQTYLVLDRKLKIDRSFQLPSSVQGVSTTVSAPVANAGLKWNAAGTAIEYAPIATGSVYVNVLNVDTMADLIGVDNTNTVSINVRGYNSIADGGGGLFNWDSTVNKSTANAGTIIDPSVSLALQGTGVGLGCWVRQYSCAVEIKWFGAKGDGVTDDTAAVQASINTLATEIDFCGIVPKITSTIALVSSQKLFNGGILSFVDNPALQGVSLSYVNIQGLNITLDGSVSISGTSRGIYLQSCTFSNIENCYVENFSDAGIRIDGGNDITIQNNNVLNCYRKSESSVDPNDAYGSIAVFGQSTQSKRVKLLNNTVFTSSTGISMFAGEGNEISGNKVVANITNLSVLSMGIYCGGSLHDCVISGNMVKGFYLEGIDIHNTGASAVAGMARITILNNNLYANSYTGISVVASAGFEIQDVTITGNTILSDNSSHLTYSHGIIIDYVKNSSCSSNTITLGTSGIAKTSFGIYVNDSIQMVVSSNNLNGDYDKNIYIQNSPLVNILSNMVDINSGKVGISFAPGTLGGRYTVVGNTVQGVDATSVLLERIGTGNSLLQTTITGNTFYAGTISIDHSDYLCFIGNTCGALVTPTIVDDSNGLIAFNRGYLDTQAGTTKTTPSTVDQWIPVERNGVTYYIPMYTSKTS